MPIYEQTPIRLKVVLVGNPPVTPIDQNTGLPPKFWRASSVGIAVGLFDAGGVPIDLSNLNSTGKLQLSLYKSQGDLVALWTKDFAGINLLPITTNGWENGTQQNATFLLDSADTDQSLNGSTSADFWLVLNGITNTGSLLLYAAGTITIYNAANALPPIAKVTPTYNAQTNNGGNFTITPTSNLHTEVVTLTGSARTSNAIVAQAGLIAGARVDVLVLAPGAAAGIILQFFIGTLGGANPFAFSTDGGTTRALFRFYFDGATLQPLEQTNPAY